MERGFAVNEVQSVLNGIEVRVLSGEQYNYDLFHK